MAKRDRYNISIYRGETFSTIVELKDSAGASINLAGATLTAQCRNKATNTVVFSFLCTKQSPESAGIFVLSLSSTTSQALTPQKGLVYDVRIAWSGGDTKHWLSGDVEIIDTVTS